MKAEEIIATIKIDDANIDYIRNHPERKINGSLLLEIKRAMEEYHAEKLKELLPSELEIMEESHKAAECVSDIDMFYKGANFIINKLKP